MSLQASAQAYPQDSRMTQVTTAAQHLADAEFNPKQVQAIAEFVDLSIAPLRHDIVEIRQDIAELRAEFKHDMAELRTEIKQDMAEMRREFKEDRAQTLGIMVRWMLSIFAVQTVAFGTAISLLV